MDKRGATVGKVAALARCLCLRFFRVAKRPGEQGWRSNLILVRRDARVLRAPVGLRLGRLEPRDAVLAELDLGWGPFRLIATHLSLGAARRRRQAEALLDAMPTAAGARMPTLLLGDPNEWRLRGSAPGVLGATSGEPPRAPIFPSFRPMASLDRIMGHPRGLAPGVEAHDSPLARRASDHLPLRARLDTTVA